MIAAGASSGTAKAPVVTGAGGRVWAGCLPAGLAGAGGGGGGGGAGGVATNAIMVGTSGSRSVAYITGSTTTSVNATACPTMETSTGAAGIYRASLGTIIATARADDRAGALATFFVVGYAALSLPVVGLGIALLYLTPQVTLLIFGLVVGIGIVGVAPTLLRRPGPGH